MIEQLQEMKARLEAATPGPWTRPLNTRWKCSVTAEMPKGDPASRLIDNTDHKGNPERVTIVTAPIWSMGGFVRKQSGRDLELIAHAPEDLAKLIAALEAVLEMANNPGDVVGWRGAPDDLANFAQSIQSTIAEALA